MNELRISLVVIGILVIVAVYAAGRLAAGRRGARRDEVRVEPTAPNRAQRFDDPEFEINLQDDPPAEDALLFSSASNAQPVPAFAVKKPIEHSGEFVRDPKPATSIRATATAAIPEQVVTLNIVARPDAAFRGEGIRKVLETLGMKLSERGLFHYYDVDDDGKRATVFLVANMLKPGTFDAATLEQLTTRGLSLFMQLPGPLSASEGLDLMLERAGSIAVRLGGTVCDEHRVPLNAQSAREMRERLLSRDFAQALPQFSRAQDTRNQ